MAVESHALAASREKALTITDDRRMLLAACAVEVERELTAHRVAWVAISTHVHGGRHRAKQRLLGAVLRSSTR